MIKKNQNIASVSLTTRRQFLTGSVRGIPVYLALPTLVSLMPKTSWALETNSPLNFFYMYIPDGTYPHRIENQRVKYDWNMSLWYPPVGTLPATLPLFLRKLETVRNDFSIVSGLRGGEAHLAVASALTGNTTDLSNDDTSALYSENDSFDQIIGAKLAGGNRSASAIQKHVMNVTMGTESAGNAAVQIWGPYMTFLNHQATFTHTSPSKLFDSVFGGTLPGPIGSGNKEHIDTLSVVLNDLKTKRNLASSADKQVLDRWLAGYEDLKKKLSTTTDGDPTCPNKPAKPNSVLDADIDSRFSADYDVICTLFMDIMLAAMECGARRVGTMMMQVESSRFGAFDKIIKAEDLHSEAGRTVTTKDMAVGHHINMAHFGEDGADMLNYMRLVTATNYFMRKYRYFIEGMKTRGIFDNTVAVCAHGFCNGNHAGGGQSDMPFLAAGNGGGFRTGQHHRLTNLAPAKATGGQKPNQSLPPPANFWKSILKFYGITTMAGSTGDCDQLFG